MIELNAKQKNQIESDVLAEYPNEMCGILTADDFIKIDNVHPTPSTSFTMRAMQFAEVIDVAVAVVHSHVKRPQDSIAIDLRTPSLKDIKVQKLSGLPWLIVATEGLSVTQPLQIPRQPNAIYEGRDFIWHINDCYTLVQDYYHFEFNIELPDAPESFDPMKNQLDDCFAKFVSGYGFKDVFSIEKIRNGDVVVLDSLAFKNNHLGIYHDEMILHQSIVSRFDPFDHFKTQIRRILRYAG